MFGISRKIYVCPFGAKTLNSWESEASPFCDHSMILWEMAVDLLTNGLIQSPPGFLGLIDSIPDGKYIAVLDCNAYSMYNNKWEWEKKKKSALVLLPLQFHTFFTLYRESLVA